MFPLTVLEINGFDGDKLADFLREKISQAPDFFRNTPVIVSPADRGSRDALADTIALVREFELRPIGLRGPNELSSIAAELGLALLPSRRSGRQAAENPDAARDNRISEAATSESNSENSDNVAPAESSNRLIDTPVRSGQQIYASGDLTIVAPVSAGAEILAGGNIHVYGPLRGRALAGVNGDESARIFCRSLEAELISVAGHFKLDEDFREGHWKQSVCISLDEQILTLKPMA